MDPSPPAFRFDAKRAVVVSVLQIVLVAAAVMVSQLGLPVRASMTAVMALTTLNAMLIAFLLLGVARDGRLVSVFAIIVAVQIIGLLVWPAWDIYERVRP